MAHVGLILIHSLFVWERVVLFFHAPLTKIVAGTLQLAHQVSSLTRVNV